MSRNWNWLLFCYNTEWKNACLDILHVDPANGPQLEVDAQHDHAGEQEGDAGGSDGVDGAEIQPAGGVFLNHQIMDQSHKSAI